MSRYLPDPDGWLAFVAPGSVLLLGGTPDVEQVDAAWAVVRDGRGLEAVLELLTARGLAATPPFAMVEVRDDGARAVVRGAVSVLVDGEPPLTGTGLASWAERSYPPGTAPGVQLDARPDAQTLPIDSGVVRAGAVLLGTTEPVPAAPAAAPVSDAAPAAPIAPATPVAETAADEPAAQVVAEPPAAELPEPLITGIAEATIVDVTEVADAPAPDLPEHSPGADEPSYDYLFGETVYRSVKDAAVNASAEEPAEAPAGDHDGQTILATDLKKLRGRAKAPKGAEAPPPPAPSPVHVLVLPSGVREPIAGTILVGRAPSIRQVPGARMPKLVALADHDQDISRNHVQVALEGDTVVVTDLHSKNGTTVRMPGRDPQKLRAGEPTSVIAGSVVDLGGGVELAIEPA